MQRNAWRLGPRRFERAKAALRRERFRAPPLLLAAHSTVSDAPYHLLGYFLSRRAPTRLAPHKGALQSV